MVLTVTLHAGVLWWLTREDARPPTMPPRQPITIDMLPALVQPTVERSTRDPEPSPASPSPLARSPQALVAERGPDPPASRTGAATVAREASALAESPREPDSLTEPSLNEVSLAPVLAGDFGVAEPDDQSRSADSHPVAASDGQAPPDIGDANPSQGAMDHAQPTQAPVSSGSLPSDPPPIEAPAPGPLEGRWRYLVFYGEFRENRQVAVLDYVMSLKEGRYQLYTEGQALGLLALFYRGSFRQSSAGKLDRAGFHPDRYEEQRGDRSSRTVTMLRNGLARARYDDGRIEAITPGAQDRLSLGAQLAWLASTHSPRLHEQQWTVELIGVGSLRTITFTIERDVMLEMPSGPRQLIRLRSEDGDGGAAAGSLELWLAEDGGLMPVRIRLEDQRGQVLDQILAGR